MNLPPKLTINQDLGHDAVAEALAAIPELIEVHTVSGSSDLIARIAARSNPDPQRVLDAMIATRTVLRASSVIVLNTHFQGRTLNPLEAAAARRPPGGRQAAGVRSPGPAQGPLVQSRGAAKHFESEERGRRISSSQNDYN